MLIHPAGRKHARRVPLAGPRWGGRGAWDDSRVAGDDLLQVREFARPGEISAGLREEMTDCWVAVSNAGGAVGFLPPADSTQVSPAVAAIIAGLDPRCSRILAASAGDVLTGWLNIRRDLGPLVAHWGTVRYVQVRPAFQGSGIGTALMTQARQAARTMGLEQLHLALRDGTGLERFYGRLGWQVVGSWPGALRVAPGDDRDMTLMILAPL
jgi:GNAT superfamily N-acetyltransferase